MARYSVSLILICLFFLCATSCQFNQKVAPDVLRVWLGSEPDTLNPMTASDAYASQINSYIFDSLIERDPDTLEFIPKLAEKWEIGSNKLEYTFYLRKNVTWHDGKPFTADDVIFSFKTIQDPQINAPFLKVYYADIDRIEKIDDYTFKFIYKKKYFLGLSVCGSIPILPKHIYNNKKDFEQHPSNRAPIGMGPYKFERWKTNKEIILVRYENYWDKKPAIRELHFKIINDNTIALQVLKKGLLDYASLTPIQWVKQTNTPNFNKQFNKFKYLLPGYSYIGWNGRNHIFKDPQIRKAMTHLINRPLILEKVNHGLGKIVASPFFVESSQYNQNIKPLEYDPNKAMQLIHQAGWKDSNNDGWLDKNGQVFKFNFLYPNASTFSSLLAPILKEDLKNLKIDMSIERMEWAAFLNKIEKREYDATALGWSTGFEGDPYQLWHSSQAEVERGSNFVYFKNKKADYLIETAKEVFDKDQRNKLYYKFQEIIHQEQPYTFMYSSYSLVVVSKRFKNVIVHKAGLDTKEWIPVLE